MSLLQTAFPGGEITVEALGNRFAGAAFLHGLVAEELDESLLLGADGACNFLIGAVARRAAG